MAPEECQKAIRLINVGKVGVLPTDTIFGIVANINFPSSVEKIYAVKERSSNKPFVILIANFKMLKDLEVYLSDVQRIAITTQWPGPNSVIMNCQSQKLSYLHREHYSLAIRMPKPDWLLELLEQTGPIIATSANLSGLPFLNDIESIKRDLPDLDFYFDGKVSNFPSKLVKLLPNGQLEYISR